MLIPSLLLIAGGYLLGSVSPTYVIGRWLGGKDLRHRLVGWGVEEDEGVRRVHVQVDLETTGYTAGPWRSLDARVEIRVEG